MDWSLAGGLTMTTKIVIMSRFADFDYAHDAIKLGAVDYLLKPVNIQALKELMQKLVAQIISVKNAAMALGEEGSFGLEMHQVIFGRDPALSLSENSFSPLLVRAFAIYQRTLCRSYYRGRRSQAPWEIE